LCIPTVILTHNFAAFFNGLLYTWFRQCRRKLRLRHYVIQQLQAAKTVQFFYPTCIHVYPPICGHACKLRNSCLILIIFDTKIPHGDKTRAISFTRSCDVKLREKFLCQKLLIIGNHVLHLCITVLFICGIN